MPPPKARIYDLAEQIIAKEGSGVLNWALEGLDKLRAEGWQLRLNERQQRVVDDLLLESDDVELFTRDRLQVDPNASLTVTDSYAAYVPFCSDRKWTPLSRNKFGPEVSDAVARRFGLTQRNDVLDEEGHAQRGWKGLKLHGTSSGQTGQDILSQPLTL